MNNLIPLVHCVLEHVGLYYLTIYRFTTIFDLWGHLNDLQVHVGTLMRFCQLLFYRGLKACDWPRAFRYYPAFYPLSHIQKNTLSPGLEINLERHLLLVPQNFTSKCQQSTSKKFADFTSKSATCQRTSICDFYPSTLWL